MPIISVRITPRSGKSQVFGIRGDGTVLARVSAPPVDGAANQALVELLASFYGVAKSRVGIVSGHTGRNKRVEVEGPSESDIGVRHAALPRHE